MDDDMLYCVVENGELSVDFSDCSEPILREINIEDTQCDGLTNSENTKDLRDFIELYETLPELWNPTNPGYVKKEKRNYALDKLLPKFRKIKNGASRTDVRRKINTLRSNYRKELKKIVDSKRSGKGLDEVYQPTSWVFYSLQFLDKYEMPVSSTTQQTDEVSESDGLQSEVDTGQRPRPTISPIASRSNIMSPPSPQLNKRRISHTSKQNELLQKACDFLDCSATGKNNVPTIVIAWGEALTTLDDRQGMFAEKAIGDITFEAQQGNLHKHSVKINEEPWPVRSPTSFSNSSTTSSLLLDSSPQPPSDGQQTQSTISGFFSHFVPD